MTMHVSIGVTGRSADLALWDKTLAEHAAAKEASDLYNVSVHDPLYEELKRAVPFPDLCFEIEALDGKITRYRVDPGNLQAWDNHWSPVIRRNAAAVRDAWLAYRKTHERLGLDAVNEESDRLCDAQGSIEAALIEMPAPDQSALLWKLEHLFGPAAWDGSDFSPSWCAKWMKVVMDDARRLLGIDANPLTAWSAEEKIAA
ncbi:hypothetical protein [Sphingobium bisphenolivorans]|uniref:hypothetical protein n=1 Tax=Sphingobium bisphenolivorans TaxID=1335760 RepID=UPI0003A8C021|nr:hypothetical protein [Sphingobium bisphenolivorans]